MSAGLYKEFVLRHGGVWAALIEFVKTHAKACVDQGAPLRVIVTAEERKRNAEQNRYYWSAVLQHIAEHAEVGGKRYDKEVWHEFFARRFGLCDEVTLPDGEVVVRRKSTTQMTVGEFSDYLHAVQAYAVMRLRVEFE
ncbi:conserved hypothetical protein [Candidatus Glomeribacter gigasporarum BEG34]|uniref:NinB protein n=1 Tax=Candidatus Glomeribacter gigasporarum BEG34 TaxID=1070319 RepID=G2JAX0_9BURK|nr:recombination protein NinB [Candidatus Glomeribacter gigasporarum]CCD29922.1 conserved hypothetical protein [Candidatus Glomeribacter gigasporarum BEG34]